MILRDFFCDHTKRITGLPRRLGDVEFFDLVEAAAQTDPGLPAAIEDLDLSGTLTHDITLMGMASHFPNLRRLELCGLCLAGDGLKYLTDLSLLRSLCLSATKIGDLELAHLILVPALEELDLSETQITDRALRAVARCEQLAYICLRKTAVTLTGLRLLAQHPKLKRLCLGASLISACGRSQLCAALPSMEID